MCIIFLNCLSHPHARTHARTHDDDLACSTMVKHASLGMYVLLKNIWIDHVLSCECLFILELADYSFGFTARPGRRSWLGRDRRGRLSCPCTSPARLRPRVSRKCHLIKTTQN